MTPETITWREVASSLPDADTNVMLFCEELGAFEGFLDGEKDDGTPQWRDVTALPADGITHWSEMPQGPITNRQPLAIAA